MRKSFVLDTNVILHNAQALTSGNGWVPLGPAPLASDASGFGQQDYGWVSGRATAVAVNAITAQTPAILTTCHRLLMSPPAIRFLFGSTIPFRYVSRPHIPLSHQL